MLEIAPEKVAHIIVRAREYDGKVAAWDDDAAKTDDEDSDSILEDRASDATRSELSEFIANLNEDEQVHLVALMWVGRGSFLPEEFGEALSTARTERVNTPEDYVLGEPMLADYLEDGLDKLGYSIEDVERGIL